MPIATIHPVDIKTISKGDYVTPENIESIYGTKQSDPDYWMCQLRLKDYIERKSDFRCKCDQGGLRVMTDEELDDYLWEHSRRATHKLVRCANDTALIDASRFDAARKQLSESRARCQQMVAVAAKATRDKTVRRLKLFGPREPRALAANTESE